MATTTMHKNPTERAKGVGLLILQAVISIGVHYWIQLWSFNMAGCDDSCNYALAEGTVTATFWIGIGAFLVSVVVVIVLSQRGKASWWAPAIGTAIVLVMGAITTIAISVATSGVGSG